MNQLCAARLAPFSFPGSLPEREHESPVPWDMYANEALKSSRADDNDDDDDIEKDNNAHAQTSKEPGDVRGDVRQQQASPRTKIRHRAAAGGGRWAEAVTTRCLRLLIAEE